MVKEVSATMKDFSITGMLVLAVVIAVAILIANWASKTLVKT